MKFEDGFSPKFSDDSAQNAATIFEHTKNFIHSMYANNLFIKDGIIYNTTYGCSKQYICANAMQLSYVLYFTHRVKIYKCINATGHGRSKIDGINGSDKIYLKQKMYMIGTEESNDKSMRINSASMICDKDK